MARDVTASAPNMNQLAAAIADLMASQAAALRLRVDTLGNGARVVDAGINAAGGV